MALNARQQAIYQHRMDIWRRTENLSAAGKRQDPTWARIATAVPCYFETGESVKEPAAGFVVSESDNLFTLDKIHCEQSVTIANTDVVKQTTGPNAGEFWEVRGDAQVRSLRANKLSVRAARLPKAPTGVS